MSVVEIGSVSYKEYIGNHSVILRRGKLETKVQCDPYMALNLFLRVWLYFFKKIFAKCKLLLIFDVMLGETLIFKYERVLI